MRQKFDLQLFAAGDNNDLPARSYQLEFKRLLQAVFKKQSYGVQPCTFLCPLEYLSYNRSGNGVNDELMAIVLGFQITIRRSGSDVLSVLHCLTLLGFDLAGNVHGIGFVYHISQRDHDAVLRAVLVGGIIVLVDS